MVKISWTAQITTYEKKSKVINPEDFHCPACFSEKVDYIGHEDTEMWECRKCDQIFSVEDWSHT